jgi:hypothetical protein
MTAVAAAIAASSPSEPPSVVVHAQPPLGAASPLFAGVTQCPPGSHSAGKTQSRTETQAVLQLEPEQTYGAQSIVVLSGDVRVCIPSHEAPALATHVCSAAQWKFVAQSASVAHEDPQALPLQTYGVHIETAASAHWPFPLQVAAAVAVPFAHEAARHIISAPGKPRHALGSMPSQDSAAHTPPVPVEHAARMPWGAPRTGVHVPGVFARSHASHCPVQAALQQTPSTQ